MKLKIAILGTRGIPNRYGGFEQLAEHLSKGLVKRGHGVTVYSSHRHPYQQSNLEGVEIIHRYDPENEMGTAGQFIYDLNCIRHARKNKFDVLLFLGYTSSSLWGGLYPQKPVVISNMDGMEWKRAKYAKPVRTFLEFAESLAIKYSDFYIADSPKIQQYLHTKYDINAVYIPYGAEIFPGDRSTLLSSFGITHHNYYLLIARMEPENNVETILDGFHQSNSEKVFIVIGSTKNKFGKYLQKKFMNDGRIQFIGPLFDPAKTHLLRYHSLLYFHGHSAGGTNPSLLEAMASHALIAAHRNEFNSSVLMQDAYYFSSAEEVKYLIENICRTPSADLMTARNFVKIQQKFNWPMIIDQYEAFILKCFEQSGK
ncbi:MAG TPA: DUF1972 domain-containing protein [Chitinophagaceae bacterium]